MAGCADGYAVLETKMVRRRLERMRRQRLGRCIRGRGTASAQLAFGRVNDAARLALHGQRRIWRRWICLPASEGDGQGRRGSEAY
ncbi:MAG: hypothetical protein ACLTYN_15185 [Dysosmobacter welbionis]